MRILQTNDVSFWSLWQQGIQNLQAILQAGAELNASASMEASRAVVKKARFTSEVLESLQESLSRAADKNDSLLEAVEATEARASREGQEEGEVIMIASLTNHFKSGRVEIELNVLDKIVQ